MQNNEDVNLYVRLKRDKTTYFIGCTQLDHIDLLKRKLLIFYKGIDVQDIRLYLGTRVKTSIKQLLDDKSNIHDQDVRNDSLIHFKLRKGGKNNFTQSLDNGNKFLSLGFE